MDSEQKKHLAAQVAASVIIGIVMNTALTMLLFERGAIPVWGTGGAAFDLVPTTIMSVFLSFLIPGHVTARRRRSGVLHALGSAPRRHPARPFIHALALSIFATALLPPIA